MSNGTQIGAVSDQIISSFSDMANLVTAASYLAGTAFAVASIEKFKTHSDNPTQIPIGTPVALMAVAAVLTFLPSLTASTTTTTT